MKMAAIYARVSSEQQREETHDCEPDGGADRVREDPRVGGSEGMGVRRRRL